jgi:hypothetical protein
VMGGRRDLRLYRDPQSWLLNPELYADGVPRIRSCIVMVDSWS